MCVKVAYVNFNNKRGYDDDDDTSLPQAIFTMHDMGCIIWDRWKLYLPECFTFSWKVIMLWDTILESGMGFGATCSSNLHSWGTAMGKEALSVSHWSQRHSKLGHWACTSAANWSLTSMKWSMVRRITHKMFFNEMVDGQKNNTQNVHKEESQTKPPECVVDRNAIHDD